MMWLACVVLMIGLPRPNTVIFTLTKCLMLVGLCPLLCAVGPHRRLKRCLWTGFTNCTRRQHDTTRTPSMPLRVQNSPD